MMSIELMIILGCLLGTAFFAGIETGVISINRMRLRHKVEQGDASARIIERFLEHPDRLLGTTLVGTNLCMVVASILAASLGERFSPVWGQTVVGCFMTLFILVFTEYLPKAWFQSEPLKRCLPFALPLRWGFWLLRPLANAINWITQWLLPASMKGEPPRTLFSTKDEIDLLAQESEAHGTLSAKQRIMIRRVFELSGKLARDIMTPRQQMSAVVDTAGVTDLSALVRHTGHTRFPVQDGSGAFHGTVNFFEVVAETANDASTRLDAFVRPPLFVPETTPMMETFAKMRLARADMCLVVDAQSTVTGLITSQDVLEEIVGKL
jgi:CBS domain containing-hemolysin-like protein